jgi:TolB-like protein/tetratricopeptide (TPR) repeat protein
MTIWQELKRRNVFRVAIAYLVVGWLLIQVLGIATDSFEAPAWVMKLFITLIVIGFIPTVLFSWAFELTPEGLKKESEIQTSNSQTVHSAKKLDYITILAAVAVAAMFTWQQMNPQVIALRNAVNDKDGGGLLNQESDISTLTNTEINATDRVEINVNSIAVLPFVNMSSDQDQEYFSDGLTDTILHKLVQLPDLRVAARTSSFKFKGLNEDMREIAIQLGVANILEGSVQRQGDRVRITAQLIKGSDGSHLWSKVFDETLDDIFRVQDDIANGVATAMLKTLSTDSNSSGEVGGTKNLKAYEAYLKGMDAMRKGTPESVNIAISQLELAVNLDPDYALAWVALSKSYEGPAELGTATWESTHQPMIMAAEMAINTAPKLATAHLAYAYIMDVKGEESSLEYIKKAIELEPNNSEALAALALLKIYDNEYREALILTEKALLLNPLDITLQVQLASFKILLGDADSALDFIENLVRKNPEDILLRKEYSELLVTAGRDLQAMRVTNEILANNPNLLGALFRSSNLRLYYRDPELAEKYLLRVETLAPNRAIDDRAIFCFYTGNIQCYDEYMSNYIKFIRHSGTNKYADLIEAELMIYRGDLNKSIQLLEPLLKAPISWLHSRLSVHQNFFLAVAYEKNEQKSARDEILKVIEKDVQKSLSNGLWPSLAEPNLIRIAAIKGDAQLAAQRLSLSIKNKYPPSLNELTYYTFYDTVRDHPEFQKQMKNLETYEDEIKNTMIDEGLW